MKKILAMLVALSMAGFVSAIDVNDNLSINGFIDGSYGSSDTKTGGVSTDTTDLDLDEVEVNFLFSAGGVSAEVHVDSDDVNDFDIEQAHLSYGFEGGLSFTFGQFNTNLGLEGEDPGGLYTFSRAYQQNAFNLGDIDSNGAQEGIRVGYAADQFSASVSVYNGATAVEEAGAAEDDLDVEIAIAFTGIENLSIGGGMQSINHISTAVPGDTDVFNVNAAYTTGQLLLAGEYSNIDAAADTSAWTLLADYDVSDVLGIAVRYSEEETSATTDADRLTIAPNYAITDSLGAILEYSTSNDSAGVGTDVDSLALELTFTF